MTNNHESGPSEQLDIDFREGIVPPAATFEDTMRLVHGWRRREETSEDDPSLYDDYCVDIHIEQMLRFAAGAYANFGGGEGKLPFAVSYEQVLAFVQDEDNKDCYMVYGFDEEIAGLAHRYLAGEGDSYDAFNSVLEIS